MPSIPPKFKGNLLRNILYPSRAKVFVGPAHYSYCCCCFLVATFFLLLLLLGGCWCFSFAVISVFADAIGSDNVDDNLTLLFHDQNIILETTLCLGDLCNTLNRFDPPEVYTAPDGERSLLSEEHHCPCPWCTWGREGGGGEGRARRDF